jgi:ribose 1,5-bisphosphokinase
MPAAGPLVYVMGPSGAGKDTLLKAARAQLEGKGFAFAHRYITRDPVPGDENFVSLSAAEFAERRAAGLFAFAWHARGVDYAIGREIFAWRDAGLTVVVSGSRADFLGGAPALAGARPVSIDASPAAIAQRLAERGRESAAQIAERIARAAEMNVEIPGIVRIDNSGDLADAIAAFVAALMKIQAAGAG